MGQKRLLNAVVNIGKSGDSGRDTEAGEEGLSLQYSPKKSFLRFFPNILTFITHHLKCWTTFGKFWHRPINHERGIFQIWNLKSLKYLYSPIVANLEWSSWPETRPNWPWHWLTWAPNLSKQAKKLDWIEKSGTTWEQTLSLTTLSILGWNSQKMAKKTEKNWIEKSGEQTLSLTTLSILVAPPDLKPSNRQISLGDKYIRFLLFKWKSDF